MTEWNGMKGHGAMIVHNFGWFFSFLVNLVCKTIRMISRRYAGRKNKYIAKVLCGRWVLQEFR